MTTPTRSMARIALSPPSPPPSAARLGQDSLIVLSVLVSGHAHVAGLSVGHVVGLSVGHVAGLVVGHSGHANFVESLPVRLLMAIECDVLICVVAKT
jgi:hypothetical protein